MPALSHVVLLDDHRMFNMALSATITHHFPHIHVTCHERYEAFVNYVNTAPPDAAILDIRLGNEKNNGLDACLYLKRKHPQCVVVICSMYCGASYVEKARRCGADAFISKAESSEVLINYLQVCAVAGKAPYGIQGHAERSDKPDVFGQDLPVDLLTPRERELLDLLRQQLSLTEAAELMHICYDTAKTHRQHIMQKLNIKSQEAFYAFLHGR